jgi:hypothetical protein
MGYGVWGMRYTVYTLIVIVIVIGIEWHRMS